MANAPLIALRIPADEKERLLDAVALSGISVSEWVRVAIRKQLEGWVLPTVPTKFIPAEQVDDIEFKVSSSRETFYANLKDALIRYTTILADVWAEGWREGIDDNAPNPYRVVLDNKEEQK